MKIIPILMIVFPTLTNSVLGIQIEIKIAQPSTREGTPVTINCYEDNIDGRVIGGIQSLAIEAIYTKGAPLLTTTPSIIKKRQSSVEYEIKPLVKLLTSGDRIWGNGFDFRTRSTLSGSVRSGRSSLSLNIMYTTCTDNLIIMCVAAGTEGTVDSDRKQLRQNVIGGQVLGIPVIRGGRRCPNTDVDYTDRCDVYAGVGDTFDLRCLADVGIPVGRKIISWYLGNMDTFYKDDRFVTTVQNASSGECNGKLISTLKYRHMPWETESEVVVTCSVEIMQGNSELSTKRSAKVSVCYEGSSGRTYSLTEIQMAGLGFAGFLSVLIIIAIILLCICCCGRKLTVQKRYNLSIAKVQASELRHEY